MKSNIPEKIHKNVCPTESAPGKLCGNEKIYKLLSDDVNKLPLRPIVSNILTATYETLSLSPW